jgi:hypothetical protein
VNATTTVPSTAAARDETPISTWNAILWWEYRRIPFNLALLVIGVGSVLVVEAVGQRILEPGEDAVEPMLLMAAIVAYAVAANLFYTLGWVVELIVRRYDPVVGRKSARVMFKLGFVGSCLLTTAPIWLALVVVALGAIFRQR